MDQLRILSNPEGTVRAYERFKAAHFAGTIGVEQTVADTVDRSWGTPEALEPTVTRAGADFAARAKYAIENPMTAQRRLEVIDMLDVPGGFLRRRR